MMTKQKILLLNGSPRKKGTSHSFARGLADISEGLGMEAEIVHIIDFHDGKEDVQSMAARLADAEYIGLVSPLYIDTLPYPVLQFFERLSDIGPGILCHKGFFAVIQCGFPVNSLMLPALNCCRFFAETMQLQWLGGLTYGGGAIINGTPLEAMGRKGRKIKCALTAALGDVLQGIPIHRSRQEAFNRDIPRVVYKPMAALLNHMSKNTGKKNGYTYEALVRKAYGKIQQSNP